MIKYKGHTSDLLTDISIRNRNIVDLQTSEAMLQWFFNQVLTNMDTKAQIRLVTALPCWLKPFCIQQRSWPFSCEAFVENSSKSIPSILTALHHYLPDEMLLVLCASFPAEVLTDYEQKRILTGKENVYPFFNTLAG